MKSYKVGNWIISVAQAQNLTTYILRCRMIDGKRLMENRDDIGLAIARNGRQY